MNYKAIMGFGKKKVKSKIIKEEKVNKYILSESIISSDFFEELTPVEQLDLQRYIGNEVQIFDENIGFDKMDSIVNGIRIPSNYLIKK